MAIKLNKSTTDEINWGDVNTYDAPTNLTYMFWYYRENINLTNDAQILLKGTNVLFYAPSSATPNGIACGIFGSAERKVSTANQIPAATWVHIAFTYTSAPTWAIYVNGVAATLSGTDWTLGSNASSLIFQDNTGANTYVSGYRAWTVTLTADEVAREVYSFLPQRTDSLIHWTPMHDGLGIDYSGQGNNATLTGTNVGDVGATGEGFVPDVLLGRKRAYRLPRTRRNQFRRLSPFIPYHQSGA